MNNIEYISEILRSDLQLRTCPSVNNSMQKDIIFQETDRSATLKILKIKNCSTECQAFSLDGSEPFSSYFNDDHDTINTRCDIALFFNDKIILIDAKSNCLKKTHVNKQLNNTRIYVKYLISLIEYLNNNTINLPIYMCVIKIDELVTKNTMYQNYKSPTTKIKKTQEKLLDYKIIRKNHRSNIVEISLSEIEKVFLT